MTSKERQKQPDSQQPAGFGAEELIMTILKTNDQFQHQFGRLFREHGLTQPQYNILRILYSEDRPMRCLEVAGQMVTVVPAITSLLDKLEKRNLITRVRCDQDRRVWYVELTRDGRTLVETMQEPVLNLCDHFVGHLSEKERTQLGQLLDKARSAVEAEQSRCS
ncbi:MAG: MarR family winged helix-turn-helix transcriptional regulator [Maioricimonas sp. JB045]|uniref:MarR family winged helix-turn-helix transcriptional regulator n=1 Tax=Maioricimonas sp. JC845 TaxID=3232138 RepID=UPI003459BE4A